VQSRILEGHCAIVTGAARGLGLAIVEALADHGARVVLADLDGGAVEAAAVRLTGEGATVVAAKVDVTDEQSVEDLLTRCRDSFGPVSIMVNNAGITRDAMMKKMSLGDFRAVIDVHLQGTWLGMKAAAVDMRAQGRGTIINMGSTSGKSGALGQTNYSTAKAGIVGMTKAAAKELARFDIRVNAIQPGLIRTAMTESMPKEAWDRKMAEIPLGRAGEPSDVANAALFLASNWSTYITGAVIEVSGGRYM